jgi:hypothetical protein
VDADGAAVGADTAVAEAAGDEGEGSSDVICAWVESASVVLLAASFAHPVNTARARAATPWVTRRAVLMFKTGLPAGHQPSMRGDVAVGALRGDFVVPLLGAADCSREDSRPTERDTPPGTRRGWRARKRSESSEAEA